MAPIIYEQTLQIARAYEIESFALLQRERSLTAEPEIIILDLTEIDVYESNDFFQKSHGPIGTAFLYLIALILFACGGILCLIAYQTRKNNDLFR